MKVTEYKRANPQKTRAWAADYRKRHAEEIAAYNKATKHMQAVRGRRRYEKRREEILKYGKDFYANNKEVVLKRNAKYRAANRDSLRAQRREYKKQRLLNDPCFRFIETTRRRILNALAGIGSKSARTVELLGCTGEDAVSYLEKKFAQGMSWANRREWHIDHIKPLASFDLTDPEQQRIAFHYSNLQPLWARENRRKGKKVA